LTEKTFEKGDIVRALENSLAFAGAAPSYAKGEEYIVKSQRGGRVQTVLDSSGSRTNGWSAEFFELVPPKVAEKPAALQTQIGGAHYTDMKIQPIEYIQANRIPFPEGNVIKYVSRWRSKGGIKDLRKAAHHLELLIEYEVSIGTE
jgi:hypothetical protein